MLDSEIVFVIVVAVVVCFSRSCQICGFMRKQKPTTKRKERKNEGKRKEKALILSRKEKSLC